MRLPIEDQIERNAPERAKLIQLALEELTTPVYRDQLKMLATEKWMKYQSYVNAGFSDSQAFALILGGGK